MTRDKKMKPYGEPQSKLDRVFKRDKGLCWICTRLGLPAAVKRQDASLDHIIPKVKLADYGMTPQQGWKLNNLRLAHKLCNSKRGAQSEEEMFDVIDWEHFPASQQMNTYTNRPKGLRYKK